MSGEELAERLGPVLARALGDDGLVLGGFRRLSGGASRETWAFEAKLATGEVRPLVLRRDPPGRPASPSGGMAFEGRVIKAAGEGGVPVPGIVAAVDEESVLGSAFLVMDSVPGETIPRRILREPEYGEARRRLAGQCGEALAHLHRVPPAFLPGLAGGEPLDQFRALADGLGQPHPVFELAFRWLEDNRPPFRPGVVVHGDFRHGNLIVGPEGLRAVLDWELTHQGDPLEDIGWLCNKAWRFGVDRPVGGFGTYDELLDSYEAAGGGHVDRDELRWWEVLSTLKWGVMCITQTVAHTSGALRSVELAAIGRRVCEQEWDLLELLPPPPGGVWPQPSAAPPAGPGAAGRQGSSLHDIPSAAGLVEAVREFVQGDVMASTEGRVRFHARVAVNVLGMVERELVLGPEQEARHARGLAGLGVADDAELALAIRGGEMDGRLAEVWSVMLEAVR
ncbi:MAG TPA: phosphotransferase family protein, partial [Acidimicrobiales bacterium]|nr:phosphotransferase family protein [Acidimicrobiales bacterium]